VSKYRHHETEFTMILRSYSKTMILAPIESAYGTSDWSSIVNLVPSCCPFQRYYSFCSPKPESHFFTHHNLFRPNFRGVPL